MFQDNPLAQLNDSQRDKWINSHTIIIAGWRCYCLASCMGVYLTYQFL